jgi:hypothetical protein
MEGAGVGDAPAVDLHAHGSPPVDENVLILVTKANVAAFMTDVNVVDKHIIVGAHIASDAGIGTKGAGRQRGGSRQKTDLLNH